MKIKIGDKVYLQKYEVLRLIKDGVTVPGCMAYEYIGDEGYHEVRSEKDEYDFACCFKAEGSVDWLMKHSEIVDYDEYANIPADDLRSLMKRLMCEHNELIDTFGYHTEEYKKKHEGEYKQDLGALKWKMHSISILIDAIEGDTVFTYPEEYTSKRLGSHPIKLGASGIGLKAKISQLLAR